jgi:ATP-dependent 26S proteasome regulatory subunit
VAEFLRRIPEAAKNDVLIVAMTNRIEMIDPAVLRRGRFDHVIKVGYASSAEVHALLDKQLSDLPTTGPIDSAALAERLSNRPLSDVAFVIREAARLAARAGKSSLDEESLHKALDSAPLRDSSNDGPRRVGFM